MSVRYLSNLDEFAGANSGWDALWARTEMAFPSTQAALLSQWTSHFAPSCDFAAVVVERDGCLQAALPLVTRRKCGLLKIAELPGNEWSPIGNLLLEPDSGEEVVAELADTLGETSCSLS
ncbi:MAG: hypothetical protein MI757_16400, partial [Pirellulales bacterium]|nr:hypothetical protein [Pirellulales bacterium]